MFSVVINSIRTSKCLYIIPMSIGPCPGYSNLNPVLELLNCLRTTEEGCLAMARGRECRDSGTPRTRLVEYFKTLEEEDGYIPLKTKCSRLLRRRKGERGEEPIEEREEEDDGDEGSGDERNRGSQVELHRNINMERKYQSKHS